MNILGINAYHATPSAALVCDGKLYAAVEEERFNRAEITAARLPCRCDSLLLEGSRVSPWLISIHVAVAAQSLCPPRHKTLLRLAHAVLRSANVQSNHENSPEFPRRSPERSTPTPAKLKSKFHRVSTTRRISPAHSSFPPFEQARPAFRRRPRDFASSMWGTGSGNRMRIDGAIAFPHSLRASITARSPNISAPEIWRDTK